MEKKIRSLLRLKKENMGTMCAFPKHNSKDYILLDEDAENYKKHIKDKRRIRTCKGVRYLILSKELLDAFVDSGMRNILYMKMM